MPQLVDQIFRGIEAARETPMRRELMEKESAQREAQTELTKTRTKAEQQNIDIKNHLELDEKNYNFLNSYWMKKRKGVETTEDEDTAAFIASENNPYFRGSSPEQAREKVRAARTISSGMARYRPQFEKAHETGEGFRINWEQDPEFFNAFETYLGKMVNQGTDRTGKSAQNKKINSVFYDPSDQTVSFGLQVTDSNGKDYPAGMSYGRDANPNANIIKTPVALIDRQLQHFIVQGDNLESLMLKYGDKDIKKKYETLHQNAAETREFAKGEQALQGLLDKNPKATVEQQRAVYSQAAGESGVVSQKQIDERIKMMKQEKQPPKTVSSDLGDFEAANKFSEEDRGTVAYKKAFKDWEEEKSKRKGRERAAGRAPTEKTQVMPDVEGNLRLIDKSTGRSKPVTDESGQPIKGRKEMSAPEIARQQARETGKGGIVDTVDDDDDIPEEQKGEVVSRASSADPKMTARQAVAQVKKNMGIETPPKGVPKGSQLLPQKSKAGNPVYKDPKGKLYEVRP